MIFSSMVNLYGKCMVNIPYIEFSLQAAQSLGCVTWEFTSSKKGTTTEQFHGRQLGRMGSLPGLGDVVIGSPPPIYKQFKPIWKGKVCPSVLGTIHWFGLLEKKWCFRMEGFLEQGSSRCAILGEWNHWAYYHKDHPTKKLKWNPTEKKHN